MVRMTVLAFDPEDRGYKTLCHIWKGRTQGQGKYPVAWMPKISTWANGDYPLHKFVWEEINGKMPEGLVPDHLCGIHQCINPEHIEAVTQQENTLRGNGLAAKNAMKTHCPQNHEYTPENTYTRPGTTFRRCIKCARASRKKYK